MQPYQLKKKIKRTKSRLKRSMKRLLNKSEKIPYVQVKQKNAKNEKFN